MRRQVVDQRRRSIPRVQSACLVFATLIVGGSVVAGTASAGELRSQLHRAAASPTARLQPARAEAAAIVAESAQKQIDRLGLRIMTLAKALSSRREPGITVDLNGGLYGGALVNFEDAPAAPGQQAPGFYVLDVACTKSGHGDRVHRVVSRVGVGEGIVAEPHAPYVELTLGRTHPRQWYVGGRYELPNHEVEERNASTPAGVNGLDQMALTMSELEAIVRQANQLVTDAIDERAVGLMPLAFPLEYSRLAFVRDGAGA
jgi:hypothetical protein